MSSKKRKRSMEDETICSSQPFDIDFHPFQPLLAAALVSGEIELFNFDHSNALLGQSIFKCHQKACRCVKFFPNGVLVASGGSDNQCIISDVSGRNMWKKKTNTASVNALQILDESVFASGDDFGCVKVWDLRGNVKRPLHEIAGSGDFVTDMASTPYGDQLVITSGNTLSIFDMRKGKVASVSDPQEDDLLCVEIVKSGKKLVCGSQQGSLDFFTWNQIRDLDDRLTGHAHPIEAMAKLDETSICTGAADGKIRIVSLFPNRIAGVIGHHGSPNEPVQALSLNSDKTVLASCGHNLILRFVRMQNAIRITQKVRKQKKKQKETNLQENTFFANL